MKESIVDKYLCTEGFLPPRNDEEMIAFEKLFSRMLVDTEFHVDVNRIVNGGCYVKPTARPANRVMIRSNDIRIAARNFEEIPKEVIEKIKKQHKGKDD